MRYTDSTLNPYVPAMPLCPSRKNSDASSNETATGYGSKRRSELFTWGLFQSVQRHTAFFVKNTRKKWAVAQFGHYREAVKKYHELAKEKHEGIYLKALAYSTPYGREGGREIDALVLKGS